MNVDNLYCCSLYCILFYLLGKFILFDFYICFYLMIVYIYNMPMSVLLIYGITIMNTDIPHNSLFVLFVNSLASFRALIIEVSVKRYFPCSILRGPGL